MAKQLGVWFGLPVCTAVFVSIAFLAYFIQSISAEISAYIGYEILLKQSKLPSPLHNFIVRLRRAHINECVNNCKNCNGTDSAKNIKFCIQHSEKLQKAADHRERHDNVKDSHQKRQEKYHETLSSYG